jgi:hypothetical protein
MRISIAPDESLIVQTEKIEIGKGNHTSSSIIREVWSVFPLLLLGVFVFARSNFKYQLFLEIIVSFSVLIDIWGAVYNIFFKIGGRKISREYQLCPNGHLLFHPQIQTLTIVDNTNIIKEVDVIVTVNEDTNSAGDEVFWPDKTLYKVIVTFDSGRLCTIEENRIEIVSSDAHQIAFRELIAETHSAVQQIKLFLAESSLSDGQTELEVALPTPAINEFSD